MIWLYFCLIIPSLPQVHKYLGWTGVGIYLVVVGVALPWVQRIPIAQRYLRPLTAATLILIVAAFLALYPIAKSGVMGSGSDGEDSVNVAVRRMLHGQYPYYGRTYLGNAIHEMPGMLLLSTPFVLLGNSAYMNLFWLAALLYVLRGELGDERRALLLFGTMLALSPVVMQLLVTGNPQLSNAIFVAVALWWMVRYDSPIAAVLLGLALSSRANFLLVLPLAFAYEWREFGVTRAVRDAAIAIAVFAAVTAPFYLHDPQGFTPLEGADRLTRFDAILPHLGEALGIAGVLLTLALAARRPRELFANCAMVQAFFVVAGALLSRDLSYAGYGLFFLFFGLLARKETPAAKAS